MAIIKAKLRELRDGDVRYISLVDRAATRLPFRVLKRDEEKETEMGIDLTGVFKRDRPVQVLNVAVLAQKNEAATTAVREAIEQVGFKTNLVQKAEGDVMLYRQSTVPPKNPVMVRLSDQVIVDVDGLAEPTGFMAEVVKECGFLPNLSFASAEMTDRVTAAVAKGDLADVPVLISDLANYTQLLATVPDAVFKLDEAVQDVVQSLAPAEKMDTKDEPDKGADEDTESDAEKAKEQTEVKKKKASKVEVTKADKKSKAKDTSADEADEDPAEEASESADEEAAEDAEEPDEQDKKKKSYKTEDTTAILSAIQAIKGELHSEMQTGLKALSTKVEGVVQTQTAQQALLDGVVKKTDALSETLKTTVTAPAASTDRTTRDHRALKVDSDPRTGFFDTAFMPRANRR